MAQHKQNRKTYLVGGAVRDHLLGLNVEERDWVVVGSTPAALLEEGYAQVGKDFPVFLHPTSKEEYALARTERKVNAGHKGFDCDASETITLEEDLGRRDLTINAIAQDDEGNLIDPYSGTSDLENRILRHISAAFEEDPLRILRVARFLAKFGQFNFQVAGETKALCKKMVGRGDLEELPAERVFQELDKALSTEQPALFFEFLNDISAGDYLWPDLTPGDFDRLQKVTTDTNSQRFAVLLIRSSSQSIKAITEKLRTPRSYTELAMLCHDHFNIWTNVDNLTAEQLVSFLYRTDAFRKTERFLQIGTTCDAINSLAHAKAPNLDTWRTYFDVTTTITSSTVDANLKGPAIGAAIKKRQIEAVERLSNNNNAAKYTFISTNKEDQEHEN